MCSQFKACQGTAAGEVCTDWSPATSSSTKPLDEAAYSSRDVSWYGEDYSGYSLYKKFQASDFIALSFPNDPFAYVGYELNSDIYKNNPDQEAKASCSAKTDWTACGQDNGGRCYKNKCVYPFSGSFPKNSATSVETTVKYLDKGICKAYPEKTSPYSSTIATQKNIFAPTRIGGVERSEVISKLPTLEGANVCQNSDCSCEYQKVNYANGLTDYYDYFSKT